MNDLFIVQTCMMNECTHAYIYEKNKMYYMCTQQTCINNYAFIMHNYMFEYNYNYAVYAE